MPLTLLTPGPVKTKKNIREALFTDDINHREPEFSEILSVVRKKLLKAFNGTEKHEIVVFSGSGTSAIEATLSSTLSDTDKILVLNNGAFGDRFTEILSLHKINFVALSNKWGEPLNLEKIENILKEDKDISHIGLIYHETSTAMRNPLHEVGQLCKKHNIFLIVDATSAVVGEELNMEENNISFCTASANKCIGGVAGLSFVCFDKSQLERVKKISPRNYYLDFYKHCQYEIEMNQTPYTPTINVFYALNAALDELFSEGMANRRKRHITCSKLLRSALAERGFDFFIPTKLMSNTVTSVMVPGDINYKKLKNDLKKEGFLIYGAKAHLKDKMFQISTMGDVNEDDITLFLATLDKCLESQKEA